MEIRPPDPSATKVGKAPIASMDAMEDTDLLSGSNAHLSKLPTTAEVPQTTKPLIVNRGQLQPQPAVTQISGSGVTQMTGSAAVMGNNGNVAVVAKSLSLADQMATGGGGGGGVGAVGGGGDSASNCAASVTVHQGYNPEIGGNPAGVVMPAAGVSASSSNIGMATYASQQAISGQAPGGGGGSAQPISTVIAQSSVNANPGGVKYRHLGKSGLKVSNVSLGTMKLFNNENPEMAEQVITQAYENGINLFDVASDPMQQDRTEREFGRILRAKGWSRRTYVVCDKIYWSKFEDRSLSRKEIIESINQSLENLQMEYIDLALINKYDSNCTMEEIVRAMTYLVNSGKIMYWGTSRWSAFEIFEAYQCAREFQLIGPTCEFGEYHWFHREKVELYMAELYNKIGMGLFTWSPVSLGLCSGRPEDMNQMLIKLLMKNFKYNYNNKSLEVLAMQESSEPQNRIKQLHALAEKVGCSINQLLVAWCVRNQTSQSVVLSASTPEQFTSLFNSISFVSKINFGVYEDIDKVLSNKPARPPMISTLQQRWAATGGVPPC